MKNNSNIFVPLIAGIALIIGVLMGITLSVGDNTISSNQGSVYAKKLIDVFNVIEQNYVDEIDKEELMETTISEMLHRLDPHSNYIPAIELQRMTESIQGHFGGVGVRFTILNDTLSITNVIENSPAHKVGVEKFDQIVTVDGDTIAGIGLTNSRVQELLKGEAGTVVEVGIKRNNTVIQKKIRRGVVPVNSIVASHMMTGNVGYIRLSNFSMQSGKEFQTAAKQLLKEGMDKLVFDLRFNTGGVMGAAIDIVDAFLEQGLPIVSTKSKNHPEQIEYSRNRPYLGNVELVVLINQSSASASEIVAGAIQDNDRGIIVGRRSFGKGLVQQDINLKDGSNLRLTTSRYYTPTGRSIQKPYTGDYEDYLMDEVNRYESGELYAQDSSLFLDSLKYFTPKGKVVYGGGGIMPDVFVPLDTSFSSNYFRHLQYTNAFSDFAFIYVKRNRNLQFSSFQEFDANFKITPDFLNEFTRYVEQKHSITFRERDFNYSKSRIIMELKSEIARQFWLEDGMFYIRNKSDLEVQKALGLLTNEMI